MMYTVNGSRRQFTREEAYKRAAEIHTRTGVFVSIEQAPARRPTVYEVMCEDLGRKPTHAELVARVKAIIAEGAANARQ